MVSNTRVFSSSKVNEARFGYNSLYNIIGQQLAGVEDVDALIGVPVKITDPNSWGIPNISLSNSLSSVGNPTNGPFAFNDKVYQGVDNFSWVIGKHSLRMGGELRYNLFPQYGNEFPRGQFFFTGAFTSNANTQSGGYSAADWLLGATQRVDMAVALASDDFRNHEWASYLDDTWKVARNLTVTAGLRWEVALPMLDASQHEVGIALNQSLPQRGARAGPLQTPGVCSRRQQRQFLRRAGFPLCSGGRRVGAGLASGPRRTPGSAPDHHRLQQLRPAFRHRL